MEGECVRMRDEKNKMKIQIETRQERKGNETRKERKGNKTRKETRRQLCWVASTSIDRSPSDIDTVLCERKGIKEAEEKGMVGDRELEMKKKGMQGMDKSIKMEGKYQWKHKM